MSSATASPPPPAPESESESESSSEDPLSFSSREELSLYITDSSHQKQIAAFAASALLVLLGFFDVVVGARLRGYLYKAKSSVFIEVGTRRTHCLPLIVRPQLFALN